MQTDAPRHLELVILGDLFEFWIGDDAAPAAKPVIDALAAASKAKQRVFLMHGNRDPLIGHDFAQRPARRCWPTRSSPRSRER